MGLKFLPLMFRAPPCSRSPQWGSGPCRGRRVWQGWGHGPGEDPRPYSCRCLWSRTEESATASSSSLSSNLLLSPRMGEAGPRQPQHWVPVRLCNLLPCALRAPSLSLHFLIGGCWEDENGRPQLPAAFRSPLLCSWQACDLSGPKFLPQPSSQICARKVSWPRPLPRWTPSRCNPGQLVGD